MDETDSGCNLETWFSVGIHYFGRGIVRPGVVPVESALAAAIAYLGSDVDLG